MSDQRETIRAGLDSLEQTVQPDMTAWVTFCDQNEEHWVQYSPGQINMDWPFATPPDEHALFLKGFSNGQAIEIQAWDFDTYVTFAWPKSDNERLVEAIQFAFQSLYDLGSDFTLTWNVES